MLIGRTEGWAGGAACGLRGPEDETRVASVRCLERLGGYSIVNTIVLV